MNPAAPPIDWLSLVIIAGSALVMFLLIRRAMRGMNQQDWILLRQARSRGVDVRVPQAVTFVVFAATEETAAELSQHMRREGYETTTKQAQIQFARNKKKPGTAQEGWLVSGTRSVTLGPETLTSTRKALGELASEHQALYLGWQVADAAEPLKAPAGAAADGHAAGAGERQQR